MTISYFLHVDGPEGHEGDLQGWADDLFGPALAESDQVQRAEAYAPLSVQDQYLGEETGKLLIVEAQFESKEVLEAVLAQTAVVKALAAMPRNEKVGVTSEAFMVKACPLLDGSTPPRSASVSFVVRYYPPIENGDAFIRYYVDHHPPIMAHFPKIRKVFCYLPLDWRNVSGIAPSDSFLGNELVFDSVGDLAKALQSDARHDLRDDYHRFPSYANKSSHHAMLRRTLVTG